MQPGWQVKRMAFMPYLDVSVLRALSAVCLVLVPCHGDSVLTPQGIIDSVWDSNIRSLLLHRFPDATPEQLKEAHAYLYGGCLIQDMGYAPFSARMFSDLTHYVRSGDFVMTLLRDAQTLDEYAFALGALAHFASDHRGHPAVNHATAVIYPKLRARFGDVVTFEDNPASHLKTEFAFDVAQVSHGLYAPDAYHDFIGFKVSKPILERGFQETYGIAVNDIFGTLDLGIGTYRFAVGKLVPEMTKAAWQSKRSDIEKLSPGITRSKFIYSLPRRKYEQEWDKEYRGPGPFARFLALVFRLIPRFGPFKVMAFRPIPQSSEQDFLRSFEATVGQYRQRLEDVRRGRLSLPNYNLDTGKPTEAGDYKLADEAYVHLLDKLAEHRFEMVTPELRKEILAFFSRADRSRLPAKTLQELEDLKPKAAGGPE